MKRNMSRIKAMVKLYEYDLLKTNDNLDIFDELICEENGKFEYDAKFYQEILDGVLNNINAIDKNIAIALDNYAISRLSYVDRSLLRIGTYELMYTNTPTQIIINELVNLSKEYSEIDKQRSSKFNNGVLDKISKFVRK